MLVHDVVTVPRSVVAAIVIGACDADCPKSPKRRCRVAWRATDVEETMAGSWRTLVGALFLIPFLGFAASLAQAEEPAVAIPAPALDASAPAGGLQTVVLAGGCFWGVQAVFQ